MPLVLPSGMIDDRVKANAFDRYSLLESDDDFIGDVGKPFGPPIIFDTSALTRQFGSISVESLPFASSRSRCRWDASGARFYVRPS